ncbi:MAG: hypothetical protein R2756_08770 [Bacteroidales bacterium]
MRGHTLFNWVFTILASLVLLFVIAPLAGMFLDSSAGEIRNTVADPVVRRSAYTPGNSLPPPLFSLQQVPYRWHGSWPAGSFPG